MKPSEQCKAAGLKSLAQAVELSDFPRQTLRDMSVNHPRRFETVILGCVAQLRIIESIKSENYFECQRCDFLGTTDDLLHGEACPKCKLV